MTFYILANPILLKLRGVSLVDLGVGTARTCARGGTLGAGKQSSDFGVSILLRQGDLQEETQRTLKIF